MTELADPNAMSTSELRSARAALQMQEDVISFVRRMAQGRCDLARDEQRRRTDGTPASGMSVVDIEMFLDKNTAVDRHDRHVKQTFLQIMN